MTDTYVQYGCALCAPAGWRNFDASPTLRFERLPVIGRLYTKNAHRFPKNVEFGDIVRGLPIADGSAHVVYCSHVLEHLALDDFRTALRNTYRILEPGGLFRFVLPDLEALAREYLADPSPEASHRFMVDSWFGVKVQPRGIGARVYDQLNLSRHMWMWDFKSLVPELERVGFRDIRRAEYGDNPDPHFADVEDRGRFDGCNVAVECRR